MHASRLLTFALLFAALPAQAGDGDGTPPPRALEKRRTVYIPYKDTDDIFKDDKDRGILMKYREFLELLERAKGQVATAQAPKPVPPAEWAFVAARFEGEADERVVRFRGQFELEVLKDRGWVSVPIGIDDVAFSKIESSTPGAVLVPKSGGGYELYAEGAGRLLLDTEFVVPVNSKVPGERSMTFRLPQAAMSSFRVRLPEKGLKVEVGNSLSDRTEDDAGKTLVTAYPKGAGPFTLKWYPKPKEVKEQKALLYAESTTALRIEEGVARTATRVLYNIHQGAARKFELRFPKEYKILNVETKNRERWEPTPSGDGLIIYPRRPVSQKRYEVLFRLERIVPDITQGLSFPDIRTIATERETRTAVVFGSKMLKLKVGQLSQATQINMKASELPAELQKDLDPATFDSRSAMAFLAQKGFKLAIEAKRVEPEVSGMVTTLATVNDNEIGIRAAVRYEVKRRGVFSFKVRLPEGFNLLECGDERSVKDYRVEDGVLEVDLHEPFLGEQYTLPIAGQIPRVKGTPAFAFPSFSLIGVKKETGYLGVAAAKHLELNTERSAGLIALDSSQLLRRRLVSVGGASANTLALHVDQSKAALTLAFRYSKPGGEARIGVKRRKPKIDAVLDILADAREDLLKVEGTVRYDIKYAGVDVFRLQVPDAIVKDFKINDNGIKEKSPEKSKVEGWTDYVVKTQSKQIKTFTLRFHYEIKFADLRPGRQTDVALLPVRVLGVGNETGHLALVKHENLVIREVPGSRSKLEIKDLSELPAALKQRKAFRAYRLLTTDFTLALRIIKYNFQAPLGTLIQHLHLDEVITKEGTIQTEAWLYLQNSTEQFLRVQLPAGAVMRNLRVFGQQEKWSQARSQGEANEILVNLASRSGQSEPFVIRLRYDVNRADAALGSRGEVALVAPIFPLGKDGRVPVTKFTRQVVFGPDVATLDIKTNMTKHFEAESDLWNDLKRMVFTPIRRDASTVQVIQAIQALKQRDQLRPSSRGLYSALQNAQLVAPGAGAYQYTRRKARLFSKLNGDAELTIGYSSWSILWTIDAVFFLLILGLGVVLVRRKLVGAALYFGVAAGGSLVLATFTEGTLSHYLKSAFLGATTAGGVWLILGVWRELVVERKKRLIEVLEAETEVARARAAAAEAESRARAPSAPAKPGPNINVRAEPAAKKAPQESAEPKPEPKPEAKAEAEAESKGETVGEPVPDTPDPDAPGKPDGKA